jgi:hypothetical protein
VVFYRHRYRIPFLNTGSATHLAVAAGIGTTITTPALPLGVRGTLRTGTGTHTGTHGVNYQCSTVPVLIDGARDAVLTYVLAAMLTSVVPT